MPVDFENLDLVKTLPSQRSKDVTSFKSGWYKIGNKKAFKEGELYSIDKFPSKLVVWRDKNNKITAFDAYCHHMGDELACGELSGIGVVCPFLGWTWGEDGKCKFIPYSQKIPTNASLRKWIALEEKEEVFIWYDGDEAEPDLDGSRFDISEGEKLNER